MSQRLAQKPQLLINRVRQRFWYKCLGFLSGEADHRDMQICTGKQLQDREGKISAFHIKHVSVSDRERLCSGQCIEVSELSWHHFTCKPPVNLPKGRVMVVTSILTDDQQKHSAGRTKSKLHFQWPKYGSINSARYLMKKRKKNK